MKTSQAGIDLIKRFEGFSGNPYRCPADIPTIGYGSTRYADGREVSMSDPAITEPQAIQLLADTLGRYEKGVTGLATAPLTQSQFDALVSFAYNLGLGNLGNSTLLKKLNNRDYAGAADEFPRWVRGGGKILPGLVKRREAERKLFLEAV